MVQTLSEAIAEKEAVKKKMEQTASLEISEFQRQVRKLADFCENSCLFEEFGSIVESSSKEFIQQIILPTLSSERTRNEAQKQLDVFKKLKEKSLCNESEKNEYV